MHHCTIILGRKRASYVESYSGKNVKYDQNVDLSKNNPEREKPLAAMRSRRKRQRLKHNMEKEKVLNASR